LGCSDSCVALVLASFLHIRSSGACRVIQACLSLGCLSRSSFFLVPSCHCVHLWSGFFTGQSGGLSLSYFVFTFHFSGVLFRHGVHILHALIAVSFGLGSRSLGLFAPLSVFRLSLVVISSIFCLLSSHLCFSSLSFSLLAYWLSLFFVLLSGVFVLYFLFFIFFVLFHQRGFSSFSCGGRGDVVHFVFRAYLLVSRSGAFHSLWGCSVSVFSVFCLFHVSCLPCLRGLFIFICF